MSPPERKWRLMCHTFLIKAHIMTISKALQNYHELKLKPLIVVEVPCMDVILISILMLTRQDKIHPFSAQEIRRMIGL